MDQVSSRRNLDPIGGGNGGLSSEVRAVLMRPVVARLSRRYPTLDKAEINRRARLYLAFPKGSRQYWCKVLGGAMGDGPISHSGLSGIVQGRTRASWQLAVAMVNARPGWIALRDVLAPFEIDPHACLHPEQLGLRAAA